jgi:ABC-type transporter Mla maintaining outer membrane lipid asymmetry permease subunit MlaE
VAAWAFAPGEGFAARWTAALAPLVAALVACGSVAAAQALELERMREEGQLDAVRVMGGDPLRSFVVPRALGAALALAVLTLFADAVGLGVAGFLEGRAGRPWASAVAVGTADVAFGMARALLYGIALAVVGCGVGLALRRPARQAAPAHAGAGGIAVVLLLALLLGGVGRP